MGKSMALFTNATAPWKPESSHSRKTLWLVNKRH